MRENTTDRQRLDEMYGRVDDFSIPALSGKLWDRANSGILCGLLGLGCCAFGNDVAANESAEQKSGRNFGIDRASPANGLSGAV